MTYVIRSMSTTDWNGRDPVVPYHVYLLQPQARRGAYWSTCGEIMLFDTLEEAEAAVVAKRNEIFTHNDVDRNLIG